MSTMEELIGLVHELAKAVDSNGKSLDILIDLTTSHGAKIDKIDVRLDGLDARLDTLTMWEENLSNHVEALGVAMGAMNTRLGEVEQATNRMAQKAGVKGVPALGGSRVPDMPIAAKRSDKA